MFAIAWGGGFAQRERAGHAQAAERRAARAEREGEAAARVAVAEERARIARELHDTIALRDVEQAGRTALTDMLRTRLALTRHRP